MAYRMNRMNLHYNYVVMQQCCGQCPSLRPRAVWLLQPGFLKVFVRILRYTYNQIHTIHNSFEIFQQIFRRLHYLEMYMEKYCSSIESNMSSCFTPWHSMTTPTKFSESTSGKDESNMKWVYWLFLLNQLLNVNSIDLRLNFQTGLAKTVFLTSSLEFWRFLESPLTIAEKMFNDYLMPDYMVRCFSRITKAIDFRARRLPVTSEHCQVIVPTDIMLPRSQKN